MPEIILHAGFHKTGSSSIQQTLVDLEMPDAAYLDWGHFNHSMPFLDAFTNGELAEMKGAAPKNLPPAGQKALQKLKTGLVDAAKPRIILSAESFSVAGYKPGLIALRDLLLGVASRIRVIAYVRPLESLMASDFQQCARAGLDVPFGRGADYLQRMKMLDDVFGRENVEFHVFSPRTLMYGDVVRDFGHRIGVDIEPDQVRRANESVGLECVAVARCAARFGSVGVGKDVDLGLNYFASNQLTKLGNSKFRIAPEILEELCRPFRAELAKVQQRIGGLFPPYKAEEGGIRSDADLFEIAAEQETPLRELVTNFASTVTGGQAIAERGFEDITHVLAPEIRCAKLVDILKRVQQSRTKAAEIA